MVHITGGLLDVLLEMAADAEPQSVTVRLAVSSAEELDLGERLSAGTPVFSDLYLPSSGDPIEAVFGMDVSIPPGQTPGVFISHPHGELGLASTDDFAERILIAVPPWGRETVAAFDRSGQEQTMEIVDAPVDRPD